MQTVAANSQDEKTKELTTPPKQRLQTSLQTKSKKSRQQGDVDTSELPPDLAEIVTIWPELPRHIKAAIKALVETYTKTDTQE